MKRRATDDTRRDETASDESSRTDGRHALQDLLCEEALVHAHVVRLNGTKDGGPHGIRVVVEHYTCTRGAAVSSYNRTLHSRIIGMHGIVHYQNRVIVFTQ